MNNEALNEWMEDNTDINQIQAKVDKVMMTPKQKAIKLFNNYVKLLPFGSNVERAKQCALIAVDEIIDATTKRWGGMNPETGFVVNNVEVNPYWQEVKQEINNL